MGLDASYMFFLAWSCEAGASPGVTWATALAGHRCGGVREVVTSQTCHSEFTVPSAKRTDCLSSIIDATALATLNSEVALCSDPLELDYNDVIDFNGVEIQLDSGERTLLQLLQNRSNEVESQRVVYELVG